MQIVLASGNAGKLAEFETLLHGGGLVLRPQSAFGVDEIDETGLSFVENALLKARHAARESGMAALADDSGLCVDVLDGAPGLHSARYAGTHGDSEANIARLLEQLRAFPDASRTARFVCVLVLLRHADDPQPIIAEGVWEGRILSQPQGENGFGYDPVFFVPDQGCSAAQLTPEVKNRISHRGRALQQLQQRLRQAGLMA